MARRTNRVAWVLVGVLTVLVLIGIGTLLRRGVFFAGVSVRMAPDLIVRHDAQIRKRTTFWEVTRYYHLRSGTLVFSRQYSLSELPRRQSRSSASPRRSRASRLSIWSW